MTELFQNGLILDVLLVGMVLEATALFIYHRLTGRGLAGRVVLPYLGSGVAILLAWRVALGGAWWGWVSLCLSMGGLLHLVDLRQRRE